MEPIGAVCGLWRHPVKSMRGEACEALALDARGVTGDRLFAVRDAQGKLGSGKTTRRFQRIDGLLALAASGDGPVPRVHLPDGRTLAGDDPRTNDALSAVLGQPVHLARESTVPHMDVAPVHLITTASLTWLADRASGARIDPRRLRANVVVECPGRERVEDTWVGQRLRIGGTVELHVTSRAERCRMVGLAQDDLPDDASVLRRIAREAAGCFGVYAEVRKVGWIRRGDRVTMVAPGG